MSHYGLYKYCGLSSLARKSSGLNITAIINLLWLYKVFINQIQSVSGLKSIEECASPLTGRKYRNIRYTKTTL